MGFVYFLVILLGILLIYTMLSTIIKLSLYMTTGISYEHSRLLIPVILSILIWLLVGSLCIGTLYHYTSNNIFDEFFDVYLQKQNILPLLKRILECSGTYLLIGTLLQSFTYFAVNIKLENLFSMIRFGCKRLLKVRRKKEDNKCRHISNRSSTSITKRN